MSLEAGRDGGTEGRREGREGGRGGMLGREGWRDGGREGGREEGGGREGGRDDYYTYSNRCVHIHSMHFIVGPMCNDITLNVSLGTTHLM